MKSKSFLTFSNWYSFPTSYNYEDSCEQREEDERLEDRLFAAKWTRFTVVGAGSGRLVRCGLCVPNTRPQGFSLGLRCHHAVPYSDYGSVPLPLYLHSATTALACLFIEFQSHTSHQVCTGCQLYITFFPCSKMPLYLKCPISIEGLDLKQKFLPSFWVILPWFFSIKLRGSVLFIS